VNWRRHLGALGEAAELEVTAAAFRLVVLVPLVERGDDLALFHCLLQPSSLRPDTLAADDRATDDRVGRVDERDAVRVR
jgi:hypothetical protein